MATQGVTVINIGKKGATEPVIKEIKNRLKRKGLIKVKILKSMKEKFDEILKQILDQTGARLVKKIGFTFILTKKRE